MNAYSECQMKEMIMRFLRMLRMLGMTWKTLKKCRGAVHHASIRHAWKNQKTVETGHAPSQNT